MSRISFPIKRQINYKNDTDKNGTGRAYSAMADRYKDTFFSVMAVDMWQIYGREWIFQKPSHFEDYFKIIAQL